MPPFAPVSIPLLWCSQTADGGASIPPKWCTFTAGMVRPVFSYVHVLATELSRAAAGVAHRPADA